MVLSRGRHANNFSGKKIGEQLSADNFSAETFSAGNFAAGHFSANFVFGRPSGGPLECKNYLRNSGSDVSQTLS